MPTINVHGLSKDAETIVNEKGAKQSRTDYRFDLMDGDALFRLAGILHHGAVKYGEENWRGIGPKDHLNHALGHIYAWLAGDEQDDHLGHAFCRLMMACAVEDQWESQWDQPTQPSSKEDIDILKSLGLSREKAAVLGVTYPEDDDGTN